MDGLHLNTIVTSFNGLDSVGGLFAGRQTKVDLCKLKLAEKELPVVVSRLLLRNTRITSLDLR